MAVKIRLMRTGKKKQPTYRVVVADARSPRDGRFIEQVGRYDPRQEPSLVEIDNERALHWLGVGAQPSDAVRKLLEISGAWSRFRVAKGEIHVVEPPPAPPPPRTRPAAAAAPGAAEATEVTEDIAPATAEETAPEVAEAAEETEETAPVAAEETTPEAGGETRAGDTEDETSGGGG